MIRYPTLINLDRGRANGDLQERCSKNVGRKGWLASTDDGLHTPGRLFNKWAPSRRKSWPSEVVAQVSPLTAMVINDAWFTQMRLCIFPRSQCYMAKTIKPECNYLFDGQTQIRMRLGQFL